MSLTYGPSSPQPAGPAPSRLPLGTLVAGCLAVCLAQIALAVPATLNGLFQEDLHPIGSQLTWISDAFLLPVTVLELTFGVLGDLFGRKRLLVGGSALVVVGEAVSAVSGGVHQLWAGQVVAGLGAAALFPTTLAMIAAGTHSHRDRARGITVWAAALSTGGFVAPVIGGVTGSHDSWRAAFVVVAVLAAASTVVSLLGAGDSRAPEGRSLDLGGQLSVGIGLFALLYAVIQGPADGWGSTPVVAAFVVAAVFVVLFVVAEGRARSPLLRLDLFTNRAFAVASVVAVVGMFSFLGTAYATSIRLGPVQHQSPLRTSVAFLLLNGLTLVLAPLTSRLLERVSGRWILTVGLALMAAGDFLAATLPVQDRALTSLVLPLGPAVIGAVALSRAASLFGSDLRHSSLSPQVKAAAAEVAAEGGPLAVNSLSATTPPGGAAPLALRALGHGYALGFTICGAAALVSCLLALIALRRADTSPHAGTATPTVSETATTA
jgi:MFS family permease